MVLYIVFKFKIKKKMDESVAKLQNTTISEPIKLGRSSKQAFHTYLFKCFRFKGRGNKEKKLSKTTIFVMSFPFSKIIT